LLLSRLATDRVPFTDAFRVAAWRPVPLRQFLAQRVLESLSRPG